MVGSVLQELLNTIKIKKIIYIPLETMHGQNSKLQLKIGIQMIIIIRILTRKLHVLNTVGNVLL
jgi:hypothetical protein